MKKLIKLWLIFFLLPIVSFSQTEINIDSLIIQGKQQLQQAANKWTEPDLLNARAYFERLLVSPSKSWLIHYYIGLADSRLVSFYLSNKNNDSMKKYIEDGISHLLLCIETNDNFADAHSLLSSLYGNKIGINPLLGITLGPKAGKEMATAMSIEHKNPRNYLIAGWSAFFTPRMFGGSKDKAKKYFEQAIAHYDSFQVADPVLPDWGHDEAYTWLALVNMEQKDFDQAEANFNRALEINPEYGWVTYVLLPDLKQKMAVAK